MAQTPAEDMRVNTRIDWATINRIARECRAHLDTLSPERVAEIEEMWR